MDWNDWLQEVATTVAMKKPFVVGDNVNLYFSNNPDGGVLVEKWLIDPEAHKRVRHKTNLVVKNKIQLASYIWDNWMKSVAKENCRVGGSEHMFNYYKFCWRGVVKMASVIFDTTGAKKIKTKRRHKITQEEREEMAKESRILHYNNTLTRIQKWYGVDLDTILGIIEEGRIVVEKMCHVNLRDIAVNITESSFSMSGAFDQETLEVYLFLDGMEWNLETTYEEKVLQTATHEFRHAAQFLELGRDTFEDFLHNFDYDDNPLEIDARNVADKALAASRIEPNVENDKQMSLWKEE